MRFHLKAPHTRRHINKTQSPNVTSASLINGFQKSKRTAHIIGHIYHKEDWSQRPFLLMPFIYIRPTRPTETPYQDLCRQNTIRDWNCCLSNSHGCSLICKKLLIRYKDYFFQINQNRLCHALKLSILSHMLQILKELYQNRGLIFLLIFSQQLIQRLNFRTDKTSGDKKSTITL